MDQNLLHDVVAAALKAGADAAEAVAAERQSLSVTVRMGALEEVEAFVFRHPVLQRLLLFHDFLGAVLIVPESLLSRLRLKLGCLCAKFIRTERFLRLAEHMLQFRYFLF